LKLWKKPRFEAVGKRPARRLCDGRTAAGTRCKAIASSRTGLCIAHEPGGSERMAKLGRRGGQARERTEAETLIGMGLGHMVAIDALYEVATSPLTSEKDRLRAALAVLAQRPPVRVERAAGDGVAVEVSYRTSPAGQANTGDPSRQGFPTSQPEDPPELTAEEQRQLVQREREARREAEHREWMARMAEEFGQARPLEELAEIQWRELHPNGRRHRGRRRSAFCFDTELTG
jgi:hypothetical protein